MRDFFERFTRDSNGIWHPPPSCLENSNVRKFMDKHGVSSFRELVQISAHDIEWFWGAVEKDLQIEWFLPYTKILDVSDGKPWARWFVGGKINVAANCLDKHLSNSSGHRLALISENERGGSSKLTYQGLSQKTNQLANMLRRLGVKKGDRVAFYMPTIPEAIAALLATAKIGAVAVPIFSGFGSQALAKRIEDSGAVALFTVDVSYRKGNLTNLRAVVLDAIEACPNLRHVITLRRSSDFSSATLRKWTSKNPPKNRTPKPSTPQRTDPRELDWEEAEKESAEAGTERTDSEDPFLIIYTSGTTARPKGAVHVHGGALVKFAQEVAYQLDLREDNIFYWVSDLGWIMGPWQIIGTLALGATAFIYEGALDYPNSNHLWSMVQNHKISILGVSPALIRRLMQNEPEPRRRFNLDSLRILACASEPITVSEWSWYFEKVGDQKLPVINLSGGTEVGACFLSTFPISPLKASSLGGPALGMDVDVVGADGRPVRGAVGELVCGKPWPSMTRGLWNDRKRFIETYWSRWPNLWYHGDWASIDADGFWYLHGRSDDTIKISGRRIGPDEIESVLRDNPAVLDAVAIAVPDQKKGQTLRCFVALRQGVILTDAEKRELASSVEKALGKAFRPSSVDVVKQIPRTRTGKIVRRAIRAVLSGQEVEDQDIIENLEALEEIAPH